MSYYDQMVSFSELVGKTITEIKGNVNSEQLYFICSDGTKYIMEHHQNCCESVSIDDIVGDLTDLLDSPIIQASEDSNCNNGKPGADSFTWTFYNIATTKGHVTIKWYGESNGYYSEEVSFCKVKE